MVRKCLYTWVGISELAMFEFSETSNIGFAIDGGAEEIRYPTLAHFIESEKFRPFGAAYRNALLSIDSIDDLLFETNAISKAFVRADWSEIHHRVVLCGLMSVYSQSQELQTALIRGVLAISSEPYNDIMVEVFESIQSSLASVVMVIGGNDLLPEDFDSLTNEYFEAGLPHWFAAYRMPGFNNIKRYARSQYVPILELVSPSDIKQYVSNIYVIPGTIDPVIEALLREVDIETEFHNPER